MKRHEKTQANDATDAVASSKPLTVTIVPPDTGPMLGVSLVTDALGCIDNTGPLPQSCPLLLTWMTLLPDTPPVCNPHTTRSLSTHIARTLVRPLFREHARLAEFTKCRPVTVTVVISAAGTLSGITSLASATASYRNWKPDPDNSPSSPATSIDTGPPSRAGVMHVTCVELTTCATAQLPPIEQPLATVPKCAPLTTTCVPPDSPPLLGETSVTTATASENSKLPTPSLYSRPMLNDTATVPT